MSRNRLYLLLIVLAAFAARTWQLDSVPPGWSDDELSNIYVLSQKIFQGDFSVYYTDATGLEAPYHVISGIMLRLVGFNAPGIRLLSVFLGVLTIPLTYQVARRLYDRQTGLIAAAALAFSFWSLIYSRVNLRHIALPVLALATIHFFWLALFPDTRNPQSQIPDRKSPVSSLQSLISTLHSPFLPPALLLGLSLYTYFASRGLPLILGAFILYLLLFDRDRLRRRWGGVALFFVAALLVALPLIITVQQETGADARVAEVAVPLVQARQGDFEPLLRHVRVTLSMFHADGDDEHLYNIPHRPLFGPPGALFLWSGVVIAAWLALQPLRRRLAGAPEPPTNHELASAFLLLWWVAGIAPGFLSVPPASLGHTILAQPATYILFALPLWALAQRLRGARSVRWLPAALGLLLVGTVAWRDLPDYFIDWPEQGMVRFLYHADLRDVAQYVAQQEDLTDFAISGLLAGPWDRLALQTDLQSAGVDQARPRWYHAQRAAFLSLSGDDAIAFSGFPHVPRAYDTLYQPTGHRAGSYHVTRVSSAPGENQEVMDEVCFQNELCLIQVEYEPDTGDKPHVLHLTWRVRAALQLPPIPLLSKPPPPDTYDGPRLLAFAQRWRAGETFIAGDDGLWVDPLTLQAGDVFRQQHWLGDEPQQEGDYLLLGLYDPLDGRRILTEDGRDQVRLEISAINPSGGQ